VVVLKITIEYDDGTVDTIVCSGIVVESADKRRYKYYRGYLRTDTSLVLVHAYKTTDEPPQVVGQLNIDIDSKLNETHRYTQQADELIAQSRSRMVLQSPQLKTCVYCGSRATNEHNGKSVCTSCLYYIEKYGENSDEFKKYLTAKFSQRTQF